MELTKKELLDFETEWQLIQTKIKSKLKTDLSFIANKTEIDRTQLINFREGRRNFSLKRLLQIARIIAKE